MNRIQISERCAEPSPSPPRPPWHRGALLGAAGLWTAGLLAGCGPAPVADSINIAGSSTVQPFFSRTIDGFAPDNELVSFQLDFAGSGDGTERLCDGLADISGSTRELSPNERQACLASGTELAKLPVARNAVVVFVNRKRPVALSCLSLARLYSVIGPESANVSRFSQGARIARAVGERDAAPAGRVRVIGPPPTSGTADLLASQAVAPFASVRSESVDLRPDYESFTSDSIIPGEVERDRWAVGFADFDRAAQFRSRVRFLAIDSGRGCVVPTAKTISDGSYPLSRLQLVYVNLKSAAAKPALKSFVDFMVEPQNMVSAARASGLPLDNERNRQTAEEWERASSGGGS